MPAWVGCGVVAVENMDKDVTAANAVGLGKAKA